MNDLEPEAFTAVLGKLLKDLEKSRKRLEAEMKAVEDPDQLAGHVRLVKELAISAVDLSKEGRAWAKTHREIAKTLTLAERCDLTVQFLSKLSAVDKREMRTRILAALDV